jgi:hypothetical protein
MMTNQERNKLSDVFQSLPISESFEQWLLSLNRKDKADYRNWFDKWFYSLHCEYIADDIPF